MIRTPTLAANVLLVCSICLQSLNLAAAEDDLHLADDLHAAGGLHAADAPSAPGTPSAARHDFHFVVLGDSQFDDPPAFNRLIDQARLLMPAFVVQVGDMIEGYADVDTVLAEWGRFKAQIGPLGEIPFVPVAGNHDLYNGARQADKALEQLFVDEWQLSDSYHVFDYANARFIILNSDAPDAERRLSARQFAWLQRTLKENDAEHVFVFLHRPPRRLANGDDLHTLLRRHPVRYVFYGHYHHLHFEERDGIRYVMTNAAADAGLDHPAVGSFDHLLQVSVRDAQVSVAVIEADAIDTPAAYHSRDNEDVFQIKRGLAPDSVVLEPTGENQFDMVIPLHNPTERALTLLVSCGSTDDRWQFDPIRIPTQTLTGHQRSELRIAVAFSPNRVPESDPGCQLRLPFQTGTGAWIEESFSVIGTRQQSSPTGR